MPTLMPKPTKVPSGEASQRMPATFLPPRRTSLGHLRTAAGKEAACPGAAAEQGFSAFAGPPANEAPPLSPPSWPAFPARPPITLQRASPILRGRAGMRAASGPRMRVARRPSPGGARQARSAKRPRPALCSSAMMTLPGRTPALASLRASSMVELVTSTWKLEAPGKGLAMARGFMGPDSTPGPAARAMRYAAYGLPWLDTSLPS